MSHLAKNRARFLILIIILFTLHAKGFSQLKADFTSNPTSGCAPIVVQFTDQSTGTPTQWQWDLGNGVVSYMQNPSATYFEPGTYHVKLIVRSANAVDSIVKSQYITVYPNPVPNFKASDTIGCFPLSVQFTDQSTTATGRITNWSWDFGDGTISSAPNPLHTYTEAGEYSVTLKLTNSFGCSKTITKTKHIKIGNGVKADFSHNTPELCKAPVMIQFTNKSSGPGNVSYLWDFGNGKQSTELNPKQTYSSAGSYTVSLIAKSSQGCVDTIVKKSIITVGAISSGFNAPATVCVGQAFSLTNTSSPTPGIVSWSFGDGTSSTQVAPVKTYTIPGEYTIKLVNNFGGCLDSVTKKVVVKSKQQPVFNTVQTTGCKAPFTVSFINNTTGNNTYKWLFGDGGTSNERQPQYTYKAFGSYSVTLIAINENGCSDTLVKKDYIKIQKPTIALSGLMKTGCVPVSIKPTASIVSSEPITGYLWKFGDGTTSTDANPAYEYKKAGNYNVTLVITTASGCIDSIVVQNAVRAGDKPDAKFSLNPAEICIASPVQFTDQSTGNVDEWLWNFGDKKTSTQQHPAHLYDGLGLQTVTLIVKSNTCPDTVTVKDAVNVKPPVAIFSVSNSCTDKFTKVFSNASVGATTWEWNFGDGTVSKEANPSHTYATPGSYKVTLSVTNGNCSHSNFTTVMVINEKADFTADQKTICKGGAVKFTARNIKAANIAKVSWNFGDGGTASSGLSVSHTYTKAGKYVVTFSITDILGCTSTYTDEITVYGPTANFNAGVSAACLYNNNVPFSDLSKSDGENAIIKRVWNFGDGVMDSLSGAPYQHQYTRAGEYAVSLRVVDAYGCTDVITKQNVVVIAQPKADFISPDSLSCTDKPIRFVNKSTGYSLVYEWNFGNGSADKVASPTHNYKTTGLYTVGLVVTDKYGCKDSLKKANYINISYPSAAFAVSDSFATCPPLLVAFTNKSAHYTSMTWTFDDGNASVKKDPSHYYTMPGEYQAKLVVTGPGGCKDSVSKKIEVRGPKGSLHYEKQTGCSPFTVTLKAKTINRPSLVWDYSDGTTLSTKDSVVQHIYNRAGNYVPKLILTDATGCSVPITGKDTIKVVEVVAKFGADKWQFCDSGFVKFRDSSSSNEQIRSWEWSFGDGKSSSEQHPTYKYTNPGSFVARLVATTQTGCKDTITQDKNVEVYQSPIANVAGQLEACMPAALGFKGQVVRGNAAHLKWAWNFGNGQTSAVQDPAVQTYSKDGAFQLSAAVTDEHGCKTNVTKTITIHPLPNVDAGGDVVLCRDDSLRLTANGGVSYKWAVNNSLSCLDCDKPFAAPKETTKFYVTGFNRFGCSNTDSVKVRVRQKFSLSVSANDSICAGNSTNITATGADKYAWSPTTGLDHADVANPKARPMTSTLYSLVAKDNDNCFTQTATVFIKVNPIPTIDAGLDLSLPAGGSVQLKTISSPDVTSWQWSPAYNLSCTNCSTPNAAPKRTTNYSVTVKNSGGCTSTDQVAVSVVCNNGNLFIPNTFSPNKDGMNDRFYPRGRGIAMIRSMRIFNRWGEVVFERLNFNANDAAAGWDGTHKGQQLSPDVFIYSCEVVCENNEVLPFNGDITLIR